MGPAKRDARQFTSDRVRAMQIRAFGGPEVFEPVELPRPEPGPGRVLVRILPQWPLLPAALALACSIPRPALAAQGHGTVSAAPGTLVRWSAPGTQRCRMGARSWPALQETCYYPIDLLHKPGLIKITRWGRHGSGESALISVEPFAYPTQEIDLGDIPQANPSAADLRRDAREQVLLSKVWTRKEGPAKFTLPLGAPVRPMPEGGAFGAKRIFNGKPAAQPHTGADYAAPAGTPVLADRPLHRATPVLRRPLARRPHQSPVRSRGPGQDPGRGPVSGKAGAIAPQLAVRSILERLGLGSPPPRLVRGDAPHLRAAVGHG